MLEWHELVNQHARLVFGIAYRITGSVQDSEDVSQDAFRQAFEQCNNTAVTNWRGFLCCAATSRAIDIVRRRRSATLKDDHASNCAGPVAECEALELASRVRIAISGLPKQSAAVFALTFFEGLSREEVATTLSLTPQAVSVALFKARKRLEGILLNEHTSGQG